MIESTARTHLAETLVTRLRARVPEALDELLRRHGSEIHAVAFLIVRNESDAEEVAADTLLTAWRKIGSLRDPEALRPWLLRIATRLALRQQSRSRRLTSAALDPIGVPAAYGAPSLDRAVLREAIDSLPPRMRAVIALHYMADLPVADVAAAVGRSPNTVKTQLREALAKLREWLADGEAGADYRDSRR